MDLKVFFTEKNVTILSELLLEFYGSDESKFEFAFYENNVCLNIEIIRLDKVSLILTLSPQNDMYAPNQCFIDITERVRNIFEIKEGQLNQIHLFIQNFGSHSPKQSLFVQSSLNILRLSLNKCNFVDFSTKGLFNSIDIKDAKSMRVNINECHLKNLNIQNLNSTNSNTGYFTLFQSAITNLKIIGIRRFESILMQNCQLPTTEIRSCDSNETTLEHIESNSILFIKNSFDYLHIEKIKPQPRCLITFKENNFKRLLLSHLGSIERRFLIGLTYLKPKLQISFESNEIEKIEAKKMVWYFNTIIAPQSNKEEKKDIILLIKSYYNQKQDTLDEKLFKSFEKIWRFKSHNKWSIPLIFSYHSNRFGLSLLRPFILIIVLIFLEFLVFYNSMGDNCKIEFLKGIGDISYLLNPAHKTTIFTDYLSFCNRDSFAYNVITITDNIGRVLMGYLIFQFIDAFRYKYNLGK